MRQDGSHWLNLSKVGLEGDTRPDLGAAVADGSNYHVPEVNLAEGNLLKIAQLQTDGLRGHRKARGEARVLEGQARARKEALGMLSATGSRSSRKSSTRPRIPESVRI